MILFKSLPACRGEMVSTMLRSINSSAISRFVHWLMGRPDFSGASQASASSSHRCSAVIRAGAPGRGRSSSRSSALSSASGIGSIDTHLWRHWLTVLRLTSVSCAIETFSLPIAASRMIRARFAICCRVLCLLVSARSSASASCDKLISGGLGPGIFSPPSATNWMPGTLPYKYNFRLTICAAVY